ncbi:unnamed protein product [Allacma fusca]|uniref:NYN domain-containing protein n=1 Tax=Allacma fusca TaxID=39272 RepID=A0A8J2LSA6_9HEXA|nr:unnamed protein product [Allacma fusca]
MMDCYPEGFCILYIDNSNIFINAQKHSASEKNFLDKIQDFRCRINIGKLKEIACKDKKLVKGDLYGSEPPPVDKVWRSIRNKEIKVHTSKKSFGMKEKETDTRIAADATEDLIELKSIGTPRTFIIFSGDRDMLPVVEKAQKHGWHVHVWSFKIALSKSGILREANLNKCVKIFYIDDYFKELCFYENEWKIAIPRERSLVLTFDDPLTTDGSLENTEMLKKIEKMIDTSSQLFQLPTQYRLLQDPKSLVLVVAADENTNTFERKFRYDFNVQVWSKMEELKIQVEGCNKVTTAINFFQNWDQNDYEIFEVDDTDVAEEKDLTPEELADFCPVKPKAKKTHRKYSEFCKNSYWCYKGRQCAYSHKKEEMEFFKEHPSMEPSQRRAYKLKLCFKEKCTYKNNSYLCPYAHNVQEARCIRCQTIGLHWSDECALPTC